MMNLLTTKQYDTVEEYLEDLEIELLREECKNTFFLLTLKRAIREGEKTHYCNAIWNDQGRLVFALFLFSNSIIYGSHLLDNQFEAVDQSLEALISQNKCKDLSWLHAFQPALNRMQTYLTKNTDVNLKLIDEVSCYDIRTVKWSSRSFDLKNDPLTQLKIANDSLDFIEPWTEAYLDETTESENMIRLPTSALGMEEQIKEGNIYVLYYNNEPVSMAWKRRPTKNGIAISLVYTPKDKRGKSYANCCVSLLTELLLKEYQYVTLFVDNKKNLEDNLYTRIGYKLIGNAARLLVTDIQYKNLKNF